MLQKTKAIVLNRIKFSDTSLIVTCYTESYGIKSYILKGILTRKKAQPSKAQFQVLTQLNIVAYHNTRGALNQIKEAAVIHHYTHLHSDIIKQSLVLFLSEVLSTVLQEEEKNEGLYAFLENSLLWLDTHDKYANFHLLFLLQLTKYLGFYPDTKQSTDYFDLQEGKFMQKPSSKFFIEPPKIYHFKTLLGTNFDTLPNIKLTHVERLELLDVLIQYIQLHLHTFKIPKSLAVLQSIY